MHRHFDPTRTQNLGAFTESFRKVFFALYDFRVLCLAYRYVSICDTSGKVGEAIELGDRPETEEFGILLDIANTVFSSDGKKTLHIVDASLGFLEPSIKYIKEHVMDLWSRGGNTCFNSQVLDYTHSIKCISNYALHMANLSSISGCSNKFWREEAIKYFHGKRVLDFGCGAGIYSNLIRKAGAIEYTGLDRTEIIDVIHENLSKEAFLDLDVGQFVDSDPDEYFDVVWCSEVFHGKPDKLSFLRSLRKYFGERGWLLIQELLPSSPRSNLFDRHMRISAGVKEPLKEGKLAYLGFNTEECGFSYMYSFKSSLDHSIDVLEPI